MRHLEIPLNILAVLFVKTKGMKQAKMTHNESGYIHTIELCVSIMHYKGSFLRALF